MRVIFMLCCSGFLTQVEAQQIREAYHRVNPSVVVVHVQQKTSSSVGQEGAVNQPTFGSGVLISADGKILTAAHVIRGADQISIEFFDGQLVPARVIGTVPFADVALLQLERVPPNAAISKIGDSNKVDVGDEVFIIGAPYGLSHSLTVGHISARHEPNSTLNNPGAAELLQTDAAINSGNSGSPMFNMRGEVIGIVANILSRSGGSEGLSFAVTSRTAEQMLLEQRPFWLGLDGIFVEGNLAKALNLPQPAGILVQHVTEGSPAWRQGVRAGTLATSVDGEDMLLGGDVLLEINGISVKEDDGTLDQLYNGLSGLKVGEMLRTKVLRAGQVIELSTTITPR
jgi:S1-C subfamily serine protease